MAAQYIPIKRISTLDTPIKAEKLDGSLFTTENQAHEFIISVRKNGVKQTVTGSVSGKFIRANGTTIFLQGSIVDGDAVVRLHQDCYNVQGRFTFNIFNTQSGVTTCIYSAVGKIDMGSTETVIDAGDVVPDVSDVVAAQEAAQATINAANAAAQTANTAAQNVGSIVARPYSSSSIYTAGDYCTNNGSLYKANQDISTAEEWTASHWIQIVMGDEVTDLKSAITTILPDNITNNCITGSYIQLASSTSIGETVDLTPVSNSAMAHMVINCESGDYFEIQGRSTTGNCGYFFIDSENKLISKSGVIYETVFTAPQSGKLVLNFNTTRDRYVYKGKNKVEELQSSVAEIENRIEYSPSNFVWNQGTINPETGGKVWNANYITSDVSDNKVSIICTQGTFKISCYSGNNYLGWWDGTTIQTATSGIKFWQSYETVNLSNIVNSGYSYRISFKPSTGSNAEIIDSKYILLDETVFIYLEKKIDLDSGRISVLEARQNFQNASHSDIATRPQAIRINNIRDQLYCGYIDNEGNQGVMSYDFNTGAITRRNLRKTEADEHNQMAIYNLPDGRILAICADHASRNYHYCFRSVYPEDASNWETLPSIPAPDGYSSVTYTQIVPIGSKIYVFFRCKPNNSESSSAETWAYTSTDNGGDSWETPVAFLKSSNVKYYSFAYMYNETKAKIYCISNYSVGQTDIRFGYLDFENNVILDADGVTVIGNLGAEYAPVEYTNLSIIVSKGDTRLQMIEAYNGTDNSFVYAKFLSDASSATTRNYYCTYDNGEWTSHVFDYPLGNNPVNGMMNPLAKIDSSRFIAIRHLTGKWVMELYNFGDGTFTFVKELVASYHNNIPLMRPIVSDNVIAYLRGIFTNYLNYNVDTCIHVLT